MGAEKEAKTKRKPGRTPTSCAECRRLKLRCDRKVPCEKCVTRGCGAICPNGSLTPGPGHRLVLANTEELHDRIDRLCTRIRDLEDALRTLQASVSDVPHPLLQTSLLELKAPTPHHQPASASSSSSPQTATSSGSEPPETGTTEDAVVDAFGTLTIGLAGESTFLGHTARSEYLMRVPSKPQPPSNIIFPRISQRIVEGICPELEKVDKSLGREVFSMLPPLSEAIRLCEIYLAHGQVMYTPVSRKELFDEILTTIYRAESFDTLHCIHSLSLLFIIFALASFFDPERRPYSIDAQEYYYLANTTLGFLPPIHTTTLSAIQALIHMAQYLELSDWESIGSNSAWFFIAQAVRLGHSIGLHMNGARWKLGDDVVQRRSRIFWQVFYVDTWTSFGFGRPPSMCASYIDCPFPEDTDERVGPNGEKEVGFHKWNWQFTTLLHSIMSTAFGPKPQPYSTIIELDRKIRDFPVPLHLRPDGDKDNTCTTPESYMQQWLVLSSKEWTLLNLHRAYFAQALHEMPDDLCNHRYMASAISIYRSAWRLSRGLQQLWLGAPLLLSRVSLAWSQALSAAIVMCLLVTRSPASKMGAPSLDELTLLLQVFTEAAPQSRSAANLMGSIRSLHQKAHEGATHTSTPESTTLTPAELDRLGGKTHLISESFLRPRKHAESQPSSQPRGNRHFPSAVHPTIAQDIRNLGAGGAVFNRMGDYPTTDAQYSSGSDSAYPVSPGMQDNSQYGEGVYAPDGTAAQTGYEDSSQPLVLDATWQNFVEQLGFF